MAIDAASGLVIGSPEYIRFQDQREMRLQRGSGLDNQPPVDVEAGIVEIFRSSCFGISGHQHDAASAFAVNAGKDKNSGRFHLRTDCSTFFPGFPAFQQLLGNL